MTDRASAEGLLRGNPRNREHREETNEGRRFWRCVPLADAMQAAHDAAHGRASAEPRPDSGIDALPRLRLTGEELDGLGHGLGDEFAVDWDEYDEFVRLDDVRAIGG